MSRQRTVEALASADDAFRRGDFNAARELYAAAVAEDRSAEALDGLGQSLWFSCEIEDGIAFREEAYNEYRRRNDSCRAAQIALAVAGAGHLPR